MNVVGYIIWNPNPELFSIGSFAIKYYGLSYVLAFIVGFFLVEKMFKHDNAPLEWFYKGYIFFLLGIVIGGRLGHVFFYEWNYYSHHPYEILMIWKPGMASHGAAIGVILGLIIFSFTIPKRPVLWFLDYAALPTGIGAFFVRLGNLMNSEIVGSVTDVPWAFIFKKALVINPLLPRHPAQIYEAIFYLITFIVMVYLYWRTDARKRLGLIFGVCLAGIFVSRFFIEFFKENQTTFESVMILNMGQLLSIPMALLGIFLIIRAFRKPMVEIERLI